MYIILAVSISLTGPPPSTPLYLNAALAPNVPSILSTYLLDSSLVRLISAASARFLDRLRWVIQRRPSFPLWRPRSWILTLFHGLPNRLPPSPP